MQLKVNTNKKPANAAVEHKKNSVRKFIRSVGSKMLSGIRAFAEFIDIAHTEMLSRDREWEDERRRSAFSNMRYLYLARL